MMEDILRSASGAPLGAALLLAPDAALSVGLARSLAVWCSARPCSQILSEASERCQELLSPTFLHAASSVPPREDGSPILRCQARFHSSLDDSNSCDMLFGALAQCSLR